MTKDVSSSLIFEALLSRVDADIMECVATLNIYFTNSVGIGEHPQQIEEMNTLLEKLSSAEDKKQNLLKHFGHFRSKEIAFSRANDSTKAFSNTVDGCTGVRNSPIG